MPCYALDTGAALNLVRIEDVTQVSALPNVEGDKEELEDGWNRIEVGPK